MPASSSRPAYSPASPYATDESVGARVARFVEQNQLASMAGAFALGVVLGVLARR